jgi:hypothetical protein
MPPRLSVSVLQPGGVLIRTCLKRAGGSPPCAIKYRGHGPPLEASRSKSTAPGLYVGCGGVHWAKSVITVQLIRGGCVGHTHTGLARVQETKEAGEKGGQNGKWTNALRRQMQVRLRSQVSGFHGTHHTSNHPHHKSNHPQHKSNHPHHKSNYPHHRHFHCKFCAPTLTSSLITSSTAV